MVALVEVVLVLVERPLGPLQQARARGRRGARLEECAARSMRPPTGMTKDNLFFETGHGIGVDPADDESGQAVGSRGHSKSEPAKPTPQTGRALNRERSSSSTSNTGDMHTPTFGRTHWELLLRSVKSEVESGGGSLLVRHWREASYVCRDYSKVSRKSSPTTLSRSRSEDTKRVLCRRQSRWEKSFRHWAKVAKEELAIRTTTRKIQLTAFKRLLKRKAFALWAQVVADRRWLQRATKRVISRLKSATLHATFANWVEYAAVRWRLQWAAERVTSRLGRIVARWLSRMVHAAFAGWKQSAADRRRLRVAAKRVISRLKSTTLHATFAGWAASAAKQAADRRRLQGVSERVLRRLMHGMLHAAFTGWAESTAVRSHMRRAAQRVMRLMMNRDLHAAFAGWKQSAADKRKQKHAAVRVILLMTHRSMHSAFASWADHVTERKYMQTAAGAEEHRLRTAAARVVRLILNHRLRKAFAGWDAATRENRRRKLATSRVVALLRNRTLHRAFHQWKDWWREMSVKRHTQVAAIERRLLEQQLQHVEHSRKGQLATVLARRIQQAMVSKAFRQWWSMALQHRHIKAVLRKAIVKLKLLKIAKTYRKWLAMCKDARIRRRLIIRFNKNVLGQAFEIWCEAWMYSVEQKHLINLRAEVFERHWRETALLQHVLCAWSEIKNRIKASEYILRGVVHQSLRTPRTICCSEYIRRLHGVRPRAKCSTELKRHSHRCLLRHIVNQWLRFVDWRVEQKESQWEEEDRLQREKEDLEAALRMEAEERRTENVFSRLAREKRREKHRFGLEEFLNSN